MLSVVYADCSYAECLGAVLRAFLLSDLFEQHSLLANLLRPKVIRVTDARANVVAPKIKWASRIVSCQGHWRHDIEQMDIQLIDAQHNETQQNESQQYGNYQNNTQQNDTHQINIQQIDTEKIDTQQKGTQQNENEENDIQQNENEQCDDA